MSNRVNDVDGAHGLLVTYAAKSGVQQSGTPKPASRSTQSPSERVAPSGGQVLEYKRRGDFRFWNRWW
jgi:hypothetical protein